MVVAPPTIADPAYQGLWSWFTTVDHKRIGILYGVSAGTFFVIGGLEALVIRLQLWAPNNTLVTAQMFNALFTMHATTMIFLAIMPLGSLFFNYIMPAADRRARRRLPAPERLQLLDVHPGRHHAQRQLPAGRRARRGLVRLRQPDHAPVFAWPGHRLLDARPADARASRRWPAALNFFVTILNMRAPGMSFMRMPIFCWMTLITMVLLLLAFPSITVGLILLMFDRFFDTNFYSVPHGGDPILWQHLFWVFGHPEVYILILPAMGIVSEIIPVFSRKPLFGYAVMVYSGIAIGFLAFGVWAHHMFAVGPGPDRRRRLRLEHHAHRRADRREDLQLDRHDVQGLGQLQDADAVRRSASSACSSLAACRASCTPRRQPTCSSTTRTSSSPTSTTCSSAAASSACFAGIHYWFPKMSGRMLNETLGKWNFWTFIIFFNRDVHADALDGPAGHAAARLHLRP